MINWVEASNDIETGKIQLKEYHTQQQAIETYIFTPKD